MRAATRGAKAAPAGRVLRALRLLGLDLLLRARQGFAAAFLASALLFALFLSLVPEPWAARLLPVLAATDACFFALFFGGAFLMLERAEGCLRPLLAAPLGAGAYLRARAFVAAVYAAGAGLVVGALAARGAWSPFLLLAGAVAGSALAAPLGALIAAGSRSMNGFLLASGPALAATAAPFVLAFLPGRGAALAALLLPGGFPLALYRAAFAAAGGGAGAGAAPSGGRSPGLGWAAGGPDLGRAALLAASGLLHLLLCALAFRAAARALARLAAEGGELPA